MRNDLRDELCMFDIFVSSLWLERREVYWRYLKRRLPFVDVRVSG
jgi:hypothetical protein